MSTSGSLFLGAEGKRDQRRQKGDHQKRKAAITDRNRHQLSDNQPTSNGVIAIPQPTLACDEGCQQRLESLKIEDRLA